MKYACVLAALVLIGCQKKQAENKIEITDTLKTVQTELALDKNDVVVAGSSIGKITLGIPFENTIIGEPDFSDSAMGKSWLVWYDNKADEKNRLANWMVYTSYNDSEMKEKVISEVRTILPNFKTETGIRVGSTFEAVNKEFTSLNEVAKFRNQRNGKDTYIYDATNSGIAFEFTGKGKTATCSALIVYRKDKPINTDYIMNLPERSLPGGE